MSDFTLDFPVGITVLYTKGYSDSHDDPPEHPEIAIEVASIDYYLPLLEKAIHSAITEDPHVMELLTTKTEEAFNESTKPKPEPE